MSAWGLCVCGCGPNDHDAVIVRAICVDPGNRVLFEGTLGRCKACEACVMYQNARLTDRAAALTEEPK